MIVLIEYLRKIHNTHYNGGSQFLRSFGSKIKPIQFLKSPKVKGQNIEATRQNKSCRNDIILGLFLALRICTRLSNYEILTYPVQNLLTFNPSLGWMKIIHLLILVEIRPGPATTGCPQTADKSLFCKTDKNISLRLSDYTGLLHGWCTASSLTVSDIIVKLRSRSIDQVRLIKSVSLTAAPDVIFPGDRSMFSIVLSVYCNSAIA